MVRGEIGNSPTIQWICRGQGEIGNALDIFVKENR